MTASNPAHETPDDRNVYDATRQAMHAASTGARFDTVDARLEAITAKIDDLSRQIDKRFEQIDKRFEQVDERLARLEDRFFRLYHVLIGSAFVVIATLLGTQL